MAVQQTVKEVVDNAIDACRWRSSEQDAPTVRVVLRRVPRAWSSPEDHDMETWDKAGEEGTDYQ